MGVTDVRPGAPSGRDRSRPGEALPTGEASAGVPPRLARTGEILALVRSGSAQTTSTLATSLGVARSTVAERVEVLLQQGLLVTDGETRSARGRPSVRYRFDAGAGVVLAAQLGLSGARVAVTDLAGEVLASRTVDVDLRRGPDRVLAVVDAGFSTLLAERARSREDVLGVGVGVPGPVELATAGGEDGAADHPWAGYDVAGHVAAASQLPVFVEQDVNLLALGEHRAAWPGAGVFVCVKVGTAIGCGILVDGAVLRGGRGLAGEIGHTAVDGDTTQCVCGNLGCLNAVASGGALVGRLRAAGVDVASSRDIAAHALAGDVTVARVVRQAGRDIGRVLAGAVNLLNPDAVVVWGYLADARDHLVAGIRESVYSHTLPAANAELVITRATLGDDAGVRGAAAMVLERVLSAESVDALVHRTQSGQ